MMDHKMAFSTMEHPPRTLKIFLVENHDDTLTYLSRYLEQQGHQVNSARDMASALSCLPSAGVDVFICDIGLPDGDGWELMRRLRETGCQPFGIAMSGYGMRSDKERSFAAGFRHHLTKPFLPEELEVLLQEIELPPTA